MALMRTEKDRLYNDLIKIVKNSKALTSYDKNEVIEYITEIKNGKKRNPYVDDEILAHVIMDIAEHYKSEGVEEYFSEAEECVAFLLPFGEKTEGFEQIKTEICNLYIGENGIFGTEFFNIEFYMLFMDSKDYFQIMNIIMSDVELKDHFSDIVEFATTMSKEIDDYRLFKNELISYIHQLNFVIDDPKKYLKQRVTETRMKYGIYPGLNERTASEISREIAKAREKSKEVL